MTDQQTPEERVPEPNLLAKVAESGRRVVILTLLILIMLVLLGPCAIDFYIRNTPYF